MRLGVIRGDLPGPLFIADLEPVSKYNPSTEPRGQERYVSRPAVADVEAALSDSTTGAGAVVNGSNISATFPLTITLATDDELHIKTSSAASFTVATIAAAVYATLTDLITAVNAALVTAGVGVTCRENVAGNGVALESDTKGVDSYVAIDATANSTANTPLGLPDGSARTMPTAAAFITACLPVGGPLDVSSTTVNGVGSSTSANALSLIPSTRGTVTGIADAMAPQFIETPVALDSFLTGNMSEFLSANYNPDSRRVPALPNGAAIDVVEDDGSTAFALTLPTATSATLNSPTAGDVTIAGTGLGDPERNETMIKFSGVITTLISQATLENAGGTVSDTAIVIPASLIAGATAATTFIQVQVRQRVSAVVAVS
jgi:hypothetical protein